LNSQNYSSPMTGNDALLQSIRQQGRLNKRNSSAMSIVPLHNFTETASPWSVLERLNHLMSLTGASPSYGEAANFAPIDYLSMLSTSSMLNTMPNNNNPWSLSELNAVMSARIRSQQLVSSIPLQGGLNVAASILNHLYHLEGGGDNDQAKLQRTSMNSIV
jgi:hypothetical protein